MFTLGHRETSLRLTNTSIKEIDKVLIAIDNEIDNND